MNNILVKITDIIQETSDVKTFRLLPINGQTIDFLPGQFVFLYAKLGEENIRRAYSIANSPTQGYIDLTLKRTPGGRLTPYFLDTVKTGDVFEISKPMGKFHYSEKDSNIVLIAGGAGIVPYKSIMEYCTDKRLDTKITLLYSTTKPEEIIYKKRIDELKKKNPNIRAAYTITRSDWPGNKGRIDKGFIVNNVENLEEKIYYVCGPLDFIRNIVKIINSLGVDRRQIKRDVWA